jgi:hypothetical protein
LQDLPKDSNAQEVVDNESAFDGDERVDRCVVREYGLDDPAGDEDEPGGPQCGHVACVVCVRGVVCRRVRSGHEGFSDGLCAELRRASVNAFLLAEFVMQGGHVMFVVGEVNLLAVYMAGD